MMRSNNQLARAERPAINRRAKKLHAVNGVSSWLQPALRRSARIDPRVTVPKRVYVVG
jgi:hypothetical protein